MPNNLKLPPPGRLNAAMFKSLDLSNTCACLWVCVRKDIIRTMSSFVSPSAYVYIVSAIESKDILMMRALCVSVYFIHWVELNLSPVAYFINKSYMIRNAFSTLVNALLQFYIECCVCFQANKPISLSIHNYKQTKSVGNNHNKDSHNRFQIKFHSFCLWVNVNALLVWWISQNQLYSTIF